MNKKVLFVFTAFLLVNIGSIAGGIKFKKLTQYGANRQLKVELFKYIKGVDNPSIFLQADFDYRKLIVIYAAYQCQYKEIILPPNNEIVESLIYLAGNGIDKVKFSDGAAVLTKVLLKKYTYNFGKSTEEIIAWWNQIGKKSKRHSWAVKRVDSILSKETLTFKDKFNLFYITSDQRVFLKDKAWLEKWWSDHKKLSFREWAIDSLSWAIDNLDSDDEEVKKCCCNIIITLVNVRVLRQLGIAKNRNSLPSMSKVITNKNSLKKWFLKNKNTYHPLYGEKIWGNPYLVIGE